MGRNSPSPYSLPRSNRLRGGAGIQALFRGGTREERQSFVALWRTRSGGRRVCVAVNRRVGGAVARNRVRRRIREAYRQLQQRLPPGVDVVFIGRSAAGSRAFPALLEEMRQALSAIAKATGRAGAGSPDK